MEICAFPATSYTFRRFSRTFSPDDPSNFAALGRAWSEPGHDHSPAPTTARPAPPPPISADAHGHPPRSHVPARPRESSPALPPRSHAVLAERACRGATPTTHHLQAARGSLRPAPARRARSLDVGARHTHHPGARHALFHGGSDPLWGAAARCRTRLRRRGTIAHPQGHEGAGGAWGGNGGGDAAWGGQVKLRSGGARAAADVGGASGTYRHSAPVDQPNANGVYLAVWRFATRGSSGRGEPTSASCRRKPGRPAPWSRPFELPLVPCTCAGQQARRSEPAGRAEEAHGPALGFLDAARGAGRLGKPTK